MKQKTIFLLWGGCFVLCAALGFVPAPTGALKILLRLLSIFFFLPPALLLYRGGKSGDRTAALLIRNLSAASLLLTALLLIANLLSALASPFWGDILHGVLTVVSTPMICCGNWALSMFLWACLLLWSLQLLKQK